MRVQSSSSINLYKQCPRKYYYKYIMKLPEPSNIHAVRGNIVHSVLEHFFKIKIKNENNYKKDLLKSADFLLDRFWIEKKEELKKLNLPIEELNDFYVDSRDMIYRWTNRFCDNVEDLIKKGHNLQDALNMLKPSAEEYIKDEKIGIQGYLDAIYYLPDGKIKVVDYKTSRKDIITPEYALQAGIYAVLIKNKKGCLPEVVSFDFLKGDLKDVVVDDDLIKNTLFEIEQIHFSTSSIEKSDYQKKTSGLCKWSNERGSGQCAFFDICMPFEEK